MTARTQVRMLGRNIPPIRIGDQDSKWSTKVSDAYATST